MMNGAIIEATFDGEVLRLEKPLELAPNTRLRLVIEEVLPTQEPMSFLDTALSINLEGGRPDWSMNVDRYLYGYLHDDAPDESEDAR